MSTRSGGVSLIFACFAVAQSRFRWTRLKPVRFPRSFPFALESQEAAQQRSTPIHPPPGRWGDLSLAGKLEGKGRWDKFPFQQAFQIPTLSQTSQRNSTSLVSSSYLGCCLWQIFFTLNPTRVRVRHSLLSFEGVFPSYDSARTLHGVLLCI